MSVHLLLDLTLMPTQRWRNFILIAEFRWRRLALRCLVHVTQAARQAVTEMWQETSSRIVQTECTHPPEFCVRRANHWASMNVCDRERGGCGAVLDFSPTAVACAQREAKTKEKAKAKDSATISQRAAQIIIGVSDEKERDNVCPRCDRELYAFRTASGPIMRCRGWDLVGTPCTLIQVCQEEAVNFREKNTNRTGDGGLATGSRGPHAGLGTNTLPGQDSGSQNPTLSNDWTAQMQVLMSNPDLAQEQFAQWQLLHQHFQHLQCQQQLAASSNLESRQMFQHSGEDGESVRASRAWIREWIRPVCNRPVWCTNRCFLITSQIGVLMLNPILKQKACLCRCFPNQWWSILLNYN